MTNLYKGAAAGSDQTELDTVKNSVTIKKLGLKDDADLNKVIDSIIETQGKSNKYK